MKEIYFLTFIKIDYKVIVAVSLIRVILIPSFDFNCEPLRSAFDINFKFFKLRKTDSLLFLTFH
jgi:hypothetical protein